MANTINDLYLKYVNKVGRTLENDRYFQYLFVILYRVLVVYGSIFKLLFVCVVFLTKIHHALHERMAEVELKFRMVAIIICHDN